MSGNAVRTETRLWPKRPHVVSSARQRAGPGRGIRARPFPCSGSGRWRGGRFGPCPALPGRHAPRYGDDRWLDAARPGGRRGGAVDELLDRHGLLPRRPTRPAERSAAPPRAAATERAGEPGGGLLAANAAGSSGRARRPEPEWDGHGARPRQPGGSGRVARRPPAPNRGPGRPRRPRPSDGTGHTAPGTGTRHRATARRPAPAPDVPRTQPGAPTATPADPAPARPTGPRHPSARDLPTTRQRRTTPDPSASPHALTTDPQPRTRQRPAGPAPGRHHRGPRRYPAPRCTPATTSRPAAPSAATRHPARRRRAAPTGPDRRRPGHGRRPAPGRDRRPAVTTRQAIEPTARRPARPGVLRGPAPGGGRRSTRRWPAAASPWRACSWRRRSAGPRKARLDSAVAAGGRARSRSNASSTRLPRQGDENVLFIGCDRRPPARPPAPPRPGRPRAGTTRGHRRRRPRPGDGGGPVDRARVPARPGDQPAALRALGPRARRPTWPRPVPAEARTQLVTALDVGGPRCATRVVQQLSGLAITGYVGIDLSRSCRRWPTRSAGSTSACRGRCSTACSARSCPTPGTDRLDGRARRRLRARPATCAATRRASTGRIERQQQVLGRGARHGAVRPALLDVGRHRPRCARRSARPSSPTGRSSTRCWRSAAIAADSWTPTASRSRPCPRASRTAAGNAVLRDTDAAALFAAVRADGPLPAEADRPGAGTRPRRRASRGRACSTPPSAPGWPRQVGETLRHRSASASASVGTRRAAHPADRDPVLPGPGGRRGAARHHACPRRLRARPRTTGVLQLVLGRSFDDVVRAPAEPSARRPPGRPGARAGPPPTCA